MINNLKFTKNQMHVQTIHSITPVFTYFRITFPHKQKRLSHGTSKLCMNVSIPPENLPTLMATPMIPEWNIRHM